MPQTGECLELAEMALHSNFSNSLYALESITGALAAHRESVDSGHCSVEEFRSMVEETLQFTIDFVGSGSQADDLLMTTALLEECRTSQWLSEAQYVMLSSKLTQLLKASSNGPGDDPRGENTTSYRGAFDGQGQPQLLRHVDSSNSGNSDDSSNCNGSSSKEGAASSDRSESRSQFDAATSSGPQRPDTSRASDRIPAVYAAGRGYDQIAPPQLPVDASDSEDDFTMSSIAVNAAKQAIELREASDASNLRLSSRLSQSRTAAAAQPRGTPTAAHLRQASAASVPRQRSLPTPVAQWLRWKRCGSGDSWSLGSGEQLCSIARREPVQSAKYVMAATCLCLLALMAYSCYALGPKLVRRKATWEWIVIAMLPILFAFFTFAIKVLVSSLSLVVFTSIRALGRNSQFHSAIPTPIIPGHKLPPVVVQIPVYKEDLHEVIMPTYHCVKRAMDYYRCRGGEVKVLVCDDGLQLLDDAKFGDRMRFYYRHNVSFVARPPANRRGLFKKGSNMNYTFKVANKLQAKMGTKGISMREAVAEVWNDMGQEFVAGGDITLADDAIILLLDADTRMPADAIYLTMGEFIECPELAYTQHFTMPFDDQCRNYWEQTISSFTKKIYTVGIALGTSAGDFAPLVGHNAFLRWSAVKAAAFYDPNDGMELKYWSEEHVSEDFDMFMRLAAGDRFGRYVMYTGTGFQEGVSLTYIDECIKLRKFCYGACEMVFNKFRDWPRRGPFSPIIVKFVLTPRIRWYQKVSLLSYLATYFALAAGPWLALFEAAMNVLAPEYFDDYSVYGFDVMLTCTLIFSGIATVSEVVVRWRLESLKGVSIFPMIWDSMKFVPTITLLFTGTQFSVCIAALCYFFDLKVVWGATSKETTEQTCFEALRDTWKMFWLQYVVSVPLGVAFIVGMIYYTGGLDIVRGWGPLSFVALHVSAPIILCPTIMSLSF